MRLMVVDGQLAHDSSSHQHHHGAPLSSSSSICIVSPGLRPVTANTPRVSIQTFDVERKAHYEFPGLKIKVWPEILLSRSLDSWSLNFIDTVVSPGH